MLWALLAIPAAFAFLGRFARGWRRPTPITLEPFSGLQLAISRSRSRRTKAALDAATRLLH